MAKEKIVVIDDSPIVRKLAELALEEEGYKVYTAEDGEEGLRISEEVRPSVILVDFIMPRISGYQFCKSARENELLKDIPIILITGKGEDVGKKFAEKFGVVDYFIKPFKSEMLVEKVNSIIHSQRQEVGEEADIFGKAEEPALETPTYDFETSEFAEQPGFAAEPMPELKEEPMAEPAVKFEATDIFGEAKPAETIEEVGMPEYTFESLGVPPAEEVQEPDVKKTEEEPELAASSFDFNLEGLAAPEVEIEEQGEIGAPVMSEVHDVYDFEAMPALSEAPAEEAVKPVPVRPSEYRADISAAEVPGLEAAVDSVMRKYFSYELPILIEKSIEDILKQHSIIKQSSILLSGSLQDVCSIDVFKMVDSGELTGKFFAFAPEGSAEIYFEKGLVVHGLTSKRGRTVASARLALIGHGLSGEIEESLREESLDAIRMVASLKDGGFFFEKMAIPAALLDFRRTNVIALLLEALRQKEDETCAQDGIYTKLVSEIAVRDYGLNDMEQELFSLADGVRSVSNIALLSGLEMPEARKTLCRLAKAGVLRYKGGF